MFNKTQKQTNKQKRKGTSNERLEEKGFQGFEADLSWTEAKGCLSR